MFYKASPLLFTRAKQLRSAPTPAEMVLWGYLKTKPFGYKFRRQHPLVNFIADFFCYPLKLVIEADGKIPEHDDVIISDKERQGIMEAAGISVIRFKNEEIINYPELVIEKINDKPGELGNFSGNPGLIPPLGGHGV